MSHKKSNPIHYTAPSSLLQPDQSYDNNIDNTQCFLKNPSLYTHSLASKSTVSAPAFTAFNRHSDHAHIQKGSQRFTNRDQQQQQQLYDTPPLTNNRVPVKNVNPPSSPLASIQTGRGRSTSSSLTKPSSSSSLPVKLTEKPMHYSHDHETFQPSLSSPEAYLAEGNSPNDKQHVHSGNNKMSIKSMLISESPENQVNTTCVQESDSQSDMEIEDGYTHDSFEDEMLSSPQYFDDSQQEDSDHEFAEVHHHSPLQDNSVSAASDDEDNSHEVSYQECFSQNSAINEQDAPTLKTTCNNSYFVDSEFVSTSEQNKQSPTEKGSAKAPGPRKPGDVSIGNTPPSASPNDLDGYYISGKGLPSPRLEDLAMLYGLGGPIPREAVSPTMGTKAAAKTRERIRKRLQMQEESQNMLRQKANDHQHRISKSPGNMSLTIVSPYEELAHVRSHIQTEDSFTASTTSSHSSSGPSSKSTISSSHQSTEYTNYSSNAASSMTSHSHEDEYLENIDEQSREEYYDQRPQLLDASPNQTCHSYEEGGEDTSECLSGDETTFIPDVIASSKVIVSGPNSLASSPINPGPANSAYNSCSKRVSYSTNRLSPQPRHAAETISSRTKSRRTKSMPPGAFIPPPQVWSSPIASPSARNSFLRANHMDIIAPMSENHRISTHNRMLDPRSNSPRNKRSSIANIDVTSARVNKRKKAYRTRYSLPAASMVPLNVSPLKVATTAAPNIVVTPQFDPENVDQALHTALQRIQQLEQQNSTLQQDSTMMRSWAQNMTRMVGSINRQFDVIMSMMDNINVERSVLMAELENMPQFSSPAMSIIGASSSSTSSRHNRYSQYSHAQATAAAEFCEEAGAVSDEGQHLQYAYHNSSQRVRYPKISPYSQCDQQLNHSVKCSSTFPTPSPMQAANVYSAPANQHYAFDDTSHAQYHENRAIGGYDESEECEEEEEEDSFE